jgi:DNA-binding NarL/FixJ family response regulator
MSASGDPIRLLVVDDHPVVRDGLRGMFGANPDFDVVGLAANGVEAVELARTLDPHVILMDLRMPGIRDQGLSASVIVLTTYDTDGDVLRAIEAGASGYLLKDAPEEELFRAAHAAARGEAALAPSIATRLVGQMRTPVSETATPRELEVLRLVAGGASNREAAARLFISEATVKTHLLHLYEKLGVNDRAAAVAVAYDRGLLPARTPLSG